MRTSLTRWMLALIFIASVGVCSHGAIGAQGKRPIGVGSPGFSPGTPERILGVAPVPNPSFEDVTGTTPAGWKPARFGGQAEFAVDDVAHTGQRSVRITAREAADVAWTAVVPVKPYCTG